MHLITELVPWCLSIQQTDTKHLFSVCSEAVDNKLFSTLQWWHDGKELSNRIVTDLDSFNHHHWMWSTYSKQACTHILQLLLGWTIQISQRFICRQLLSCVLIWMVWHKHNPAHINKQDDSSEHIWMEPFVSITKQFFLYTLAIPTFVFLALQLSM